MSTFRRWAFWRRFEYGSYVAVVLAAVFTAVYVLYIYAPASCFDGQQNNGELGVDCGGDCVRICAFTVEAPRVVWAESFQIFPGQYNAVAYVENTNDTAATPEFAYTFRLYGENGLITERSNTTVLPPDSVYPIFEGRIQTNGQEVTRTEIVFDKPELWQPATIGRDQFVTRNYDLTGADASPRLNVTLANQELTEARDVEVVATIFDAAGKPLTASQTFVENFPARSEQNLTFTWPEPIAKTVRSCTIPTDVVLGIDLSGSMNNDSANPPQPLTSVLESAGTFVANLRAEDQVSVVTFASDAMVELPLTSDTNVAQQTINSLSISPDEEQGTTNTGAMLQLAREELLSSRHNQDARKVLVMLTDGLATAPEPEPDAYAQEQVEMAKAEDVEVYTVGLGQEVDRAFLQSLAEETNNAFFAPSADELAGVYSDITTAICESGAARIDIIPKTGTNFTPLR